MGVFNQVHAVIACPRCGVEDVAVVELRLGDTANMTDLRPGDRYPWVPDQLPEHGGRPPGGDAVGDGYMECEHCRKDSFVHVFVRGDVVVGIAPNLDKPPYIAD